MQLQCSAVGMLTKSQVDLVMQCPGMRRPCATSVTAPTPVLACHVCVQIQNTKKKTGVIPPKKFVQRLKRDNEQFCSYMHQVRHMQQALEAYLGSAATYLQPAACPAASARPISRL